MPLLTKKERDRQQRNRKIFWGLCSLPVLCGVLLGLAVLLNEHLKAQVAPYAGYEAKSKREEALLRALPPKGLFTFAHGSEESFARTCLQYVEITARESSSMIRVQTNYAGGTSSFLFTGSPTSILTPGCAVEDARIAGFKVDGNSTNRVAQAQ